MTGVDPLGMYKWATAASGFGCTQPQKDCIAKVIAKLKEILSSSADCFDKPGVAGREAVCRSQLTKCVLDTIDSDLEVRCHGLPGRDDPGFAGGACKDSKNLAIPISERRPDMVTRWKCERDPSCTACSGALLSHSHVSFLRVGIPTGRRCDLSATTDLKLSEAVRELS